MNHSVFNGAHLRVEGDAHAWHEFFKGGMDQVWSLHSQAAQRVGFVASAPVYVATGAYEMQDEALVEVRFEQLGEG